MVHLMNESDRPDVTLCRYLHPCKEPGRSPQLMVVASTRLFMLWMGYLLGRSSAMTGISRGVFF